MIEKRQSYIGVHYCSVMKTVRITILNTDQRKHVIRTKVDVCVKVSICRKRIKKSTTATRTRHERGERMFSRHKNQTRYATHELSLSVTCGRTINASVTFIPWYALISSYKLQASQTHWSASRFSHGLQSTAVYSGECLQQRTTQRGHHTHRCRHQTARDGRHVSSLFECLQLAHIITQAG